MGLVAQHLKVQAGLESPPVQPGVWSGIPSGKEATYQLEDDFRSCKLEVCALFQSDMYRPWNPRVRQSLYGKEKEAYLIRKFNTYNKGMNKSP